MPFASQTFGSSTKFYKQHCTRPFEKTEHDTSHQMQESLTRANRTDVLKLLKHFRLGKRNRDLGKRPLPMVELENGNLATTPEEAQARWRRHFSSIEGGMVTDPAELLHPKHHQPRHLDPQMSELPTLFELERQMRYTTPGKAMGFDMVPPELLHGSPQRLAYLTWPLFLKQNLTGIECLQHKGGRLVSAFKRKGSSQRCENHRALLVSSSLGKAFHSTFRRRTVPYVQAIAGRMQITSHATPSVAMAAHVVRAHLQGAKQCGLSAFALCLDITHAFYAYWDSWRWMQHALTSMYWRFWNAWALRNIAFQIWRQWWNKSPHWHRHSAQRSCTILWRSTTATPGLCYTKMTDWFARRKAPVQETALPTSYGAWSFPSGYQSWKPALLAAGIFSLSHGMAFQDFFSKAGTESIPRSLIAWADDVGHPRHRCWWPTPCGQAAIHMLSYGARACTIWITAELQGR